MKASRCPTACAARILAVLTAAVLLAQCSMPPQQAWRSIQTNGLLSYLSSSHASPPLRTGSLYSQRYAASSQRSSAPGANWSNWSARMPNRLHYTATTPSAYPQNNYFNAPSSSSGGSTRYVPRSKPSPPSRVHSPRVKIPVEEPSHTPQLTDNPPPVSSTPKTDSTTESAESLPYGTAIPGRMNMVNSPFAGKTQLVDVSGMSAGQTVKCPYSGKLFKVPPTQQAANRTESRLESKVEAPKTSDEPPADDKKP